MLSKSEIDQLLQIVRSSDSTIEARVEALRRLNDEEEELLSHLENVFQLEDTKNDQDIHDQRDHSYAAIIKKISVSSAPQNSVSKIFLLKVLPWIVSTAAILTIIWLLIHPPQSYKSNNQYAVAIKAKDSGYDTLSNQGPQTVKYILADKSIAWLHSKSILLIKKTISHSDKILKLYGAANFQVKNDPAHPFRVFANGVEVLDMGTVFSVKTNGANVLVHLFKGKVQVSAINANMKKVVLRPGESISVDTSSYNYRLVVSSSKEEKESIDAISSINPQKHSNLSLMENVVLKDSVSFHNANIRTVLNRLNALTDDKILYEESKLGDFSFTGRFSQGTPLLPILKMMSKGSSFKYSIQKNYIYIEPRQE